MDYSPEAFAALYEEIERQSGALLPDLCVPQDSEYKSPPYVEKHAGVQKKVTCGCRRGGGKVGEEPLTRFVSVYDTPPGKEGKAQRQRGGGYVTACAVCDNIGAWPRYEKVVYEADPDMDPTLDDDPPEEPQG